ncbi:MAG: hypothetical protein AB7S70_09140 [Hyphomicrobium sp.]|uniref:hypothetical protein n=1 Tax=Hyphomicrobium sp. TaxID=82 RepID=UPI003D0AABA2
MGLDIDAAFATIQRALEDFTAEVGKAVSEQAQGEETLAAVEYEMEQLKKLIAENALDRDAKRPPPVAIEHLVKVESAEPGETPALKRRAG